MEERFFFQPACAFEPGRQVCTTGPARSLDMGYLIRIHRYDDVE